MKLPKILTTSLSKAWYYLRVVIVGDMVSSRFFRRHFFLTGFVVIALLLMTAMRFGRLISERKIENLNTSIEVMRTEKQRQRSQYMSRTREMAMAHLVDSLNLGLSVPDKHPQIVKNRERIKIND